ncbi:hypothetical protein N825_22920 [Skermanella stibiiresistens SB22]|uniref:Uncharacterized protein n=1 Tax=Skermanella stibiiresistens SB22 TaxID=1385369 RepID=W9GZQ6_9PROT|nr:hypothetical protein N825_22920 [Skermanella stibiiresistens SB22]
MNGHFSTEEPDPMNKRSIRSYTWIPRWSTQDGAYAIERAAALG